MMNTDNYGRTVYENNYGRLVVRPITDTVPVNTIRLANIPVEARFSLEVAEQVVLITENRHTQIVVRDVNENVALVVHESPSTCWVAQIESLDYTGDIVARDAIVREQVPAYPYIF
jgi:hypothetical protein